MPRLAPRSAPRPSAPRAGRSASQDPPLTRPRSHRPGRAAPLEDSPRPLEELWIVWGSLGASCVHVPKVQQFSGSASPRPNPLWFFIARPQGVGVDRGLTEALFRCSGVQDRRLGHRRVLHEMWALDAGFETKTRNFQQAQEHLTQVPFQIAVTRREGASAHRMLLVTDNSLIE